MGYQAGTLDLSVIGNSGVAVNVINQTVKALNSLLVSTKKLETINVSSAGKNLQSLFSNIARATQSIDVRKIEKLSSAGRALSSVSIISRLDKVDFNKISAGFSQLTIAITPFINKVKEGEVSLRSLYGITSKFNGKIYGGQNQSGGIFGFARMGVSLYLVRRFARYAADIVNSGSDYIETMNLWQVAMRHNIDLAEEFVDKMNKAYGVSTKTTMQAQATFRNMIGSLGDLSVETSQKLSEAITQMAYDYSSLYNVQLSQAVEKFQSALAGQVRPIRSISGYDITEKTIHALYESLGGTKTQRQLSRTEKQLLAILAVFRQMESAGATGDLGKTLDNFANQSRMMVETFTELKSWTGLLIVDLFESWGLMIKINAALITATTIVKAIAKSRGVGDKNFIDGIFESATDANEAVDELQGKLLDFDKIRALDTTQGASDISIDEKLLQAISGYTSVIDEAQNKAQGLANTWLEFLGFTIGANGELEISEERLSYIETILKAIGISFGIVFGATALSSIVKFGTFLKTFAISPLINLGKTIAVKVLIPMAKFIFGLAVSAVKALWSYGQNLLWTVGANTAFNASLLLLIANVALLALGWKKMNSAEKVVGIFGAIGAAALAAAAAVAAFHGAWTMGTAAVAIVGGLAAIAGAIVSFKSATQDLDFFAKGASDIDGGTLFVAGEMGKTEAVYTGSNGKANVANVQQMKAAFYQALVEYGRGSNVGNEKISIVIGDNEVFNAVRKRARQDGLDFAKKG